MSPKGLFKGIFYAPKVDQLNRFFLFSNIPHISCAIINSGKKLIIMFQNHDESDRYSNAYLVGEGCESFTVF